MHRCVDPPLGKVTKSILVDFRVQSKHVGNAYSIAEVATCPWARTHFWATVAVDGLDHLNAWFARINARPRADAALQLPEPRPSAFGEGDVEVALSANAARFKK